MRKEDIKIGLKVRYDNEIVTIKEYFPQINNTSPSGDIIIIDQDGFEELVNHNELELIEDGIDCSYVGMDDYAKHTSKLEDMKINIGSILLVNKDGINEEYQVLDNSEMNPEYPFALLDVKRHRIVQTSFSLDYMNFGHYIYIDKEYEIINIR